MGRKAQITIGKSMVFSGDTIPQSADPVLMIAAPGSMYINTVSGLWYRKSFDNTWHEVNVQNDLDGHFNANLTDESFTMTVGPSAIDYVTIPDNDTTIVKVWVSAYATSGIGSWVRTAIMKSDNGVTTVESIQADNDFQNGPGLEPATIDIQAGSTGASFKVLVFGSTGNTYSWSGKYELSEPANVG